MSLEFRNMFQKKKKKDNCTGFSPSCNSINIFDKHKCNDRDHDKQQKRWQGHMYMQYPWSAQPLLADTSHPYHVVTLLSKCKSSLVLCITWKPNATHFLNRRHCTDIKWWCSVIHPLQSHLWGITSEPRNVMHLSWDLVAGNYTLTKFHHHISIYCALLCVSFCKIKPT